MNESIQRMCNEIAEILNHKVHSIWLYGSVVLNDFRPGWSDIDFLALASEPISQEQANTLLMLRQTLSARFKSNPFYRYFEGIIVNIEEYQSGSYSRLVYWGTTGQRITNRHNSDVFARYELAKYGKSVFGSADPGIFTVPDKSEMRAAIFQYYDAIRRFALETDESLYSCGWLLDIARCVYTLRHHDVIGKTEAGLWALKTHLFPDEQPLERALAIRQAPLAFKDRPETRQWLKSLGPVVQRYADVLQAELEEAEQHSL